MKINNIILDWDGTLADTLYIWINAFKNTFESFGILVEEENLASMLSSKTRRLGSLLPKNTEVEFMQRVIEQAHDLAPKESSLYINTVDTIKKLKELGKTLALVTNSNRTFINNDLEVNDLEKYFDTLVTSENVSKLKPDPEGLNLALANIKASKEETMFVGDMLTDIEAARAAGIKCTIYFSKSNSKYLNEEELIEANPDFFIYNFEDLLDIVN